MPSLYSTLVLAPGTVLGNSSGLLAGTSDRLVGKLTGRRPEGSVAPKSTAFMAGRVSWPPYHCSSTPGTEPSQGMVTAEPVLSTTTVCSLAAATAATRPSSWRPRPMVGTSVASASWYPTNTTAT